MKIKCKSCGKYYNYSESEECTYCGAFNQTDSGMEYFNENMNTYNKEQKQAKREYNDRQQEQYDNSSLGREKANKQAEIKELKTKSPIYWIIIIIAAIMAITFLTNLIGAFFSYTVDVDTEATSIEESEIIPIEKYGIEGKVYGGYDINDFEENYNTEEFYINE
ncbi:MAG: hypothetical protein RR263_01050 [Oscillospiraceae bacterium]